MIGFGCGVDVALNAVFFESLLEGSQLQAGVVACLRRAGGSRIPRHGRARSGRRPRGRGTVGILKEGWTAVVFLPGFLVFGNEDGIIGVAE